MRPSALRSARSGAIGSRIFTARSAPDRRVKSLVRCRGSQIDGTAAPVVHRTLTLHRRPRGPRRRIPCRSKPSTTSVPATCAPRNAEDRRSMAPLRPSFTERSRYPTSASRIRCGAGPAQTARTPVRAHRGRTVLSQSSGGTSSPHRSPPREPLAARTAHASRAHLLAESSAAHLQSDRRPPATVPARRRSDPRSEIALQTRSLPGSRCIVSVL